MPTIHADACVHRAAHVIGDVTLGARVSVWPTAVLRGDTAPIVVGDDSNVQDGSVLHVDHGVPCTIGWWWEAARSSRQARCARRGWSFRPTRW